MKVLFKLLIIILIVVFVLFAIAYGLIYSSLGTDYEKYIDSVEKYSKEYDVDPRLVMAIIKTESGFKEKAQSHMGAVGLMQLLPETADWVTDQMGIEYKESMLTDSDYNIMIGTYYLRYLFNYFKSEDLAILAYNGGPGNVSKWIESGIITSNPASYKKIPVEETKEYIIKVKENKLMISRIWDDIINTKGLSQWKRTFIFMKTSLSN